MTEMMGVTVTAGGSVTRKAWREFMRDMARTDFAFELAGGRLNFGDEANFGNTDDVETACRKHGISYRASSDAKYEYNGSVRVWFPDMAGFVEMAANQDGEAMIAIMELEAALNAGNSLDELVARLKPFLRPIPPMLIDGQTALDADLEDVAGEEEGGSKTFTMHFDTIGTGAIIQAAAEMLVHTKSRETIADAEALIADNVDTALRLLLDHAIGQSNVGELIEIQDTTCADA